MGTSTGDAARRALTDSTAGRWIGGLMMFQLIAGITSLQVLTAPLFAEGGYLLNASAHVPLLGASVLLTLLGVCVTLAIGVLAWSVFRARSELLAMGFLAISFLAASLSAVEQVGVLAMIEFSEAFASADGTAQLQFEALRASGSLLRNGAHYVGLLAYGVTMLVWHVAVWRLGLLPWLLPAFGLFAVALQLFAISQPILGGAVPFILLPPMGLAQLLTALWLLARGFRDAAVVAPQGN